MSESYSEAIERISAELIDLAYCRAEPLAASVDQQKSARVRAIIEMRRVRNKIFQCDLLGSQPWDMMLVLYACYLEGRLISITSLQVASGAPTSTVNRWTRLLEQRGLAERRVDERDGRRLHIVLTAAGVEAMKASLDSRSSAESF